MLTLIEMSIKYLVGKNDLIYLDFCKKLFTLLIQKKKKMFFYINEVRIANDVNI